jgi:hypothetical protein
VEDVPLYLHIISAWWHHSPLFTSSV